MNRRVLRLGGALVLAAASSPVLGQVALQGRWDPVPGIGGNPNWPVRAMHAVHLPTGEVLVWHLSKDTVYKWNMTTGSFAQVPPVDINGNPVNPIDGCEGHASLPDGSTIIVGGFPNKKAYIYTGSTWVRVPDMASARYYPTCTPGGGKIIVTAGTDFSSNSCAYPYVVQGYQVFDPVTRTWEPEVTPYVPLEAYCPFEFCTYPSMFPMPTTGDLFMAGTGTQSTCAWQLRLSPPNQHWFLIGSNNKLTGNFNGSVIYQRDNGSIEVLKCGGVGYDPANGLSNQVLPYTEIINLSAPVPQWQELPFPFGWMNVPRLEHNVVILPTGRLVTLGGQNCLNLDDPPACGPPQVKNAEWIDPNAPTPTWQSLAATTDVHGHHSTGVLLRDARVILMGGDAVLTAELFSPPYLFNSDGSLAARPVIRSAPAFINYGLPFAVTLQPNPPTPIRTVTLVRPAATTHAFDQNQRLLTLPFTVNGTTLNVTPPTDANIAPQGYYMLFVVSGTAPVGGGVPSECAYVQLRP